MSAPGVSLTKWFPPISDEPTPQELSLRMRQIYNTMNQHDQAIETVHQNVENLTQNVDANTASINTSVTKTITITDIEGFGNLGAVNDQTSQISYTVQSTDNGSLIALNDASPIAVTLNSVVTAPYFVFIANQGTGTATLTASGGVINGETSVLGGSSVIAFFDGSNWWIWFVDAVSGVFPGNAPAVAHEWLKSYDDTTGAFTQTQPAFTDISGIAQIAQGGTGTSTPALVPGTGVTITGSWPGQTINATGTGGTVTNIATTGPILGGPITATGTLSFAGTDVNSSGNVVATHLSSPLPVLQGGTGTTTPAIVPGTNVTVTGTWPNQTVNASNSGVTSLNALTGALNVVAGSGIGVTSGGSSVTVSAVTVIPPALRNTGSGAVTSGSTVTVPWPSGTLAGDLVLICVGNCFNLTSPAGWTSNYLSNGNTWNLLICSKVLTSGDISTGSVAISAAGSANYTYEVVSFIGATGGIRETDASGFIGPGTSNPVTTSSAVIASDGAIYFGTSRTVSGSVAVCTVSRGVLEQQASDGSVASSCLYAESITSSGALTATFNYTNGFNGTHQAIVIVQGIGTGIGTVTSVGMTVPSILSVAGSPITSSGTLALTLATETANTVFAGPSSGSPATPTFRAIVPADLPLGSSSAFGALKVDGTSITASAGVISAPGGGSSPLTTKGDLWGYSTTNARIPIGTDTFVLTADSTQTLGLKWAASSSGFSNPMTTAGDLITGGSGGTAGRLGIGSTGNVLTVVAGAPAWAPGGGGGASFPLNIPGIYIWGAADQLTGFSNNDPVLSWENLAGGPALSVVGTAPIYKTGILNSLPIIRFGGAGYYQGLMPDILNAREVSLFWVLKISSLSNAYTGILTDTTDANFRFYIKSSGKTALFVTSTNYDGTGSATLSTSNFYIISLVLGPVGVSVRVALASDFASSSTSFNGLSTNVGGNLGNDSAVGGRFFTGDIAEIIAIRRAVSSTELSTIENALKTKYGL